MTVRFKACACGAQIVFVRTDRGKMIPLDRMPNDDGNVIVYQQPDGRWTAHVLSKGEEPPTGVRMMPHFATCKTYRKKR